MEKASAKKPTKKTAKKRERQIPHLIHLDAETKAILEEDSAGYGLSGAAYIRMLIRKERHAQQSAHAAGR
jgi:hypothetical protein